MRTLALSVMLGLSIWMHSAASAAIIYQDSFTRSGNLNGSMPDVVNTGGATWTASTAGTPDSTDGSQAINKAGHAAFLAFTPASGFVYTLSADLDTLATGSVWEALGFTQSNTTSTPSGFHVVNTPGPWLLERGDGTTADATFLGPGATNEHDGTASGLTGYINYAIQLDTTVTAWKVTFFRNGSVLTGPFTYASNPTIHFVAIGNGNVDGHVDNFTLTEFVPEPAAVGMMGFICSIASLCVRRRGER